MTDDKRCSPCDEPVIDKLPPCPLQCGSLKCKSYIPKVRVDPAKTPIIWVLGGPGCGKGTQCKKIAAKYGFDHLSTGDLLRAEVAACTIRSKCIDDILERGELVPNDLVLDLLEKEMLKRAPQSKGFLIDGYPREKRQGPEFERHIAPCTVILYFETSAEVLRKRLMGRAMTQPRVDDNEYAISHRIQTFFENKDNVVAQYPHKLKKIKADESPENIFLEVVKVLDPIVEQVLANKSQETTQSKETTKPKESKPKDTAKPKKETSK